ncbi:homocysteine-responsive endoplasmic reticulum-resident ubiquitin-like domain member 1 protein [Austrofundulus limnaeus]|uniref:Homocysteine-responsive endoplasmic reticulum-resident ubiquitin-like domain member 1 protein n=1 Tax=Austrofundulus limnaeus TaxID=52670 RepID=A0A2I4D976_AUSLI|nr:PREDICTED: homocysteine-responsive endoplasmic reticulum-resident ubiquitin-like domain member 1 protein [Austrofundulus limnaeus]
MDGGSRQEQTTSLIIKSPNQAQEDQTIEGIHLTWTVKELKTHLSSVYPSKPAVTDQRLIFAGKLLPDHLHIKDLFRQIDTTPTLHLVCPMKTDEGAVAAGAETRRTEQPHPSSPRPSSASPVQPQSSPELRQRRQTSSSAAQIPAAPQESPAWPSTAGASHMAHPAFPALSLYSPQQLLWLQHVYARQYYMQYHAALAAAGSVPSAPATTVGQYQPVPAHQVPAPIANQNPIDNLPANQNPAQDGAFIDPGEANQNLRMNAQGGPVMEDEEDLERDWLDWLYSAARFGVLLMIVYFNSNLSRFLLVMSTLLLMYLHTAGWFPFRRRPPVQGPNNLQPPEVQHNQQNENRNPEPNPADGPQAERTEEPDGSEQAATAVLVPPHQVSVMWSAWVFFKTFFSSLVPEAPQGLAN